MKCPNHKYDAPELYFVVRANLLDNANKAEAYCGECSTYFIRPVKVVELPPVSP